MWFKGAVRILNVPTTSQLMRSAQNMNILSFYYHIEGLTVRWYVLAKTWRYLPTICMPVASSFQCAFEEDWKINCVLSWLHWNVSSSTIQLYQPPQQLCQQWRWLPRMPRLYHPSCWMSLVFFWVFFFRLCLSKKLTHLRFDVPRRHINFTYLYVDFFPPKLWKRALCTTCACKCESSVTIWYVPIYNNKHNRTPLIHPATLVCWI